MTEPRKMDGLPVMREARAWASNATTDELKAYALACFEAMSDQDKAKFWFHISEVSF